jgi:hypothetical protein
MYYNFCRIHQTLRVTPAMETGLANHAWTIEELIGLLQYEDSTISKIDNTLFRRALGEVA